LLFKAGTSVFALFNEKAKKWVSGRRNIFQKLELAVSKDDKVIWMHCASLGEFEQGYKILVSFFSPSGYEVQKNYTGADWVFYLPMDGAANARRFLDIVHPSLVIFVKYEFWYYYLKKIKYRNIPFLLISAIFRKEMTSLKWFASFQLKMLSRFTQIFLQNESSEKLLDEFKIEKNYTVAGDTRFDRVLEIAENFQSIDVIEKFCADKKVLVAGSTWPEDELMLSRVTDTLQRNDMKLIIAPHEINEKHLAEIKELFPDSILFSQLTANSSQLIASLIIDNYGMLSKLYKYGYITFVGGGFTSNGVHNVTEAAVYGKPVITGPQIEKYAEAVSLVKNKGGFIINDTAEFNKLIDDLSQNTNECYTQSSKAAYNYIRENTGAVDKILNYIQVNRLLTKL
jgi:3-deoxy-D-manno-octulosonic-acid transferase